MERVDHHQVTSSQSELLLFLFLFLFLLFLFLFRLVIAIVDDNDCCMPLSTIRYNGVCSFNCVNDGTFK